MVINFQCKLGHKLTQVFKPLSIVVAKGSWTSGAYANQKPMHPATTRQLCMQCCSSFRVHPLSVDIIQPLHESMALKSCSEMPLLPQQLQPLGITIYSADAFPHDAM